MDGGIDGGKEGDGGVQAGLDGVATTCISTVSGSATAKQSFVISHCRITERDAHSRIDFDFLFVSTG